MATIDILDLVADGEYVKRSGSTLVGDTPAGGGASALDDLTDVVITAPSTGQVLTYDGTQWENAEPTGAATVNKSEFYTLPGELATGNGAVRIPFPRAATITNIAASVGTAPTGAAIIVDVNKNGTTIFSTQANRPQIAVSTNADTTATPDVTAVAADDYLTVDVDQIGSSTKGSDLTVRIDYTESA